MWSLVRVHVIDDDDTKGATELQSLFGLETKEMDMAARLQPYKGSWL